MCGIAGLLSFDPDAPLAGAEPVVRAMLDELAHRGPDGEGVTRGGPVVFGHRRLAIIDLGGGAQPIADAANRVLLVFNGEIYNYAALRDELVGRGHTFRTRSDSEVLAAAIAEWGADCLPRLRGMFAFAAWDRQRRSLLLARDRLGKKPLYHARRGQWLAFSSELPSLLAWPEIARTPDAAALGEFLRLGYVAAPRTAIRDVQKLPAGTFLEVRLDEPRRALTPRTYWDVRYEPKLRDRAAARESVRQLVDEAVRDRLIADVPVGAFLSGGVDSSLVVTRAARLSSAPLRSFTVGFDAAPDLDERDVARRVAQLAGTVHSERVVSVDADALLPTLVRRLGEPLGDPSALPTYVVAQIARGAVKVVLTGDGGDETFAGYNRYARTRLSLIYPRLPRPVRAAARLVLGRLGLGAARLRDAEERVRVGAGAAYAQTMQVFGRDDAARLIHSDHRSRLAAALDGDALAQLHDRAPADEWLDRLLYTDLKGYLAENVLVKVDRMTMAHGIESRAPLLDHRLVELSARMPGSWKRAPGGAGKQLLREVAAELLPPWLLALPKRGFDLPVRPWMRGGPLRASIESALADSTLVADGWLDRAMVHAHHRPGDDGAASLGNRLWSLYVLELWYRQVCRRPSATVVPSLAQGST